MPTLPRYQPGVRPTADQSVVRLPAPQADTAVADAVGEASRAGFEFAERVQKAKLDNELTTADRLARESIDKTRFEIENDHSIPEEEVAPRLRAATDKIIATSADTISSNAARKGWTNRAQSWASEGDLWAAKLVRTRQVDGIRAGIIASTADLDAKAGDQGVSAETYATSVQQAKDNVTRHVASGFLSPEDGAQQIARLNQLSVKDTTMRHESRIDAMIAGGDVTGAQAWLNAHGNEMIPSVRDQIQKVIAEKAPIIEGLQKGDQIYQAAGRDLTRAARDAERIENPLLREHVQQRLVYLSDLDKKAQRDREDTALEAGFTHLTTNNQRFETLPSAVVANLSGRGREMLLNYQGARDREAVGGYSAKEMWAIQSDALYNQLLEMPKEQLIDPASWSLDDRYRASQMTPADMVRLQGEIQKRQRTGQTANAVDATMQDFITEARRLAPTQWNVGATDNKNETREAREFRGILRKYATEQSVRTGGQPVTPDEARKAVARALNAYGAAHPGWGGANPFPLPDDMAARDNATKAADIGAAAWAQAAADAQAYLKRPPTYDEIRQAYNASRGR